MTICRRTSRLGVVLAFGCVFVAAAPVAGARSLSLDERVAARRTVERVYWAHRAWPAENPGPKPAFETVLTDDFLRARALDAVRKSNALAALWNRPIDAVQLQAEMARMARETKRPEMLRELFASLGDDPLLIAETLARPVLSDRLIRQLYAGEPRFHDGVRREAAQALAGVGTASDMRLARGVYREVTWRKAELSPEEWTALETRLATQPIGAVGRLDESDAAFYAVGVLERDADSIRTATLSWPKVPFDTWWSSEGPRHDRASLSDASLGHFDPVAPRLAGTCSTPDSWTPTPRSGTPGQRTDHTAVWTGSEMILWGGWTEGGLDGAGWRYDPVLDSWSPMSAAGAPSARFGHVAVWTGTRMVIWGGSGSADFNDGRRYDPVTDTWTTMSTTGAPLGCPYATAVWTGAKMIVWGGFSTITGVHATGGVYDPVADAWTATATTGAPAARDGHTAVWTGSRMIVWGGSAGATGFGDGSLYDPATNTWTPVSLVGAPSARAEHSAVWTGSRMTVWGGNDAAGTALGDGSLYDPTTDTWTTISSVGAASARYRHTAVWTGTSMLVWGGADNTTGYLQSGGRYDPSSDSWSPMSTAGAPSPRCLHTAVWADARMIVSGGIGSGSYPVTGGRYDPVADTWSPTAAGTWAPTARKNHLAFWTGAEMLIWGGESFSTPVGWFQELGTGAKYDPALAVWTPIAAAYVGELLRGVWTGTDMLVVGGEDVFGIGTATQGYRYNLATDSWSYLSGTGMPAGRVGHTVVWSGTEMIVWGGHSTVGGVTTVLADGARYNPSTDAWTAMTGTGAPSAREDHTAVWADGRMIVWGGKNGATRFSDGKRYTPDAGGGTWASVAFTPLAARSGHTAVWTGSRMIVWGGLTSIGRASDGASYDPLADAWTSITGAGAPAPRDSHTAVWTGDRMIVWGGSTGATYLNSGAAYFPATNQWAATTLTGAPTPRAAHSAIWASPQMIVWSGSDFGKQADDSGGAYCDCTPQTWYRDADGDGFGNPASTTFACSAPAGYVANNTDCNDANASIHPGAPEVCNGADDNCNGQTDEGLILTFYADADGDGYGNPSATTQGCSAPVGYVADNTDCNDANAAIHPGASDANCNGVDDNCNGFVDEGYAPTSDGWNATTTAGAPIARTDFVGVSTGSIAIYWGGNTATGFTNTGAKYDPSADVWTATSTTNAPSAREDASAVWTGTEMLVWGGYQGSYQNTGSRYKLSTDTWTSMANSGLAGRSLHTAVWTGSKMIVWGGRTASSELGDGASYDPSTDSWSGFGGGGGSPTARFNHTAVWTGSKMIVWGGETLGGGVLVDGKIFDPSSNHWSPVSTTGAPSARTRHTAVWTGSRMIVWGGWNASGTSYSDGAAYDPATDTWTPLPSLGAPTARRAHSAVWDAADGVMLVWGGTPGGIFFNDGGRYNPATSTWSALSTQNAPSARADHLALWVAGVSRMVVWGGDDTSGDVATGGRYVVTPFSCGVGACVRQSGSTCSAGTAGYGCTPGLPVPETCNGIDDNCDGSADNGIPAPSGRPTLGESKSGTAAQLSWTVVSGVTGYDVVTGNLGTLRSSAGNFTTSTTGCLGNDLGSTTTTDPTVPAPGNGAWHLVRAVNSCGGNGSYDEGVPSQHASRDAGINAASGACP